MVYRSSTVSNYLILQNFRHIKFISVENWTKKSSKKSAFTFCIKTIKMYEQLIISSLFIIYMLQSRSKMNKFLKNQPKFSVCSLKPQIDRQTDKLVSVNSPHILVAWIIQNNGSLEVKVESFWVSQIGKMYYSPRHSKLKLICL